MNREHPTLARRELESGLVVLPAWAVILGLGIGGEPGLWMSVGEGGLRLWIGSNRELKPVSLKRGASRTKSKT